MLTLTTRFWKHILVVVVLITSWTSFLTTGMVDEKSSWRVLKALYNSIVLFLVGGLDIGFPTGGPQAVVIALWICYFLAPLLTLSFVYQIVQEKILSHLSPRLKGHTIICGLGRNGKLIYQLVKKYSPKNHKIVLIEQNPQNPYSELLEKDPATWWLKNDFTKLPVLLKAKVDRASRIFITTNMDLANLNTMVEIQGLEHKRKDFTLFCHLGDLGLHANLGATILKEKRFAHLKLFNGYHCVTKRLYENRVLKEGYLSSAGNLFVILGFGQFGKMLYTHLISDKERKTEDEIVIATLKQSFELDKLKYA